MLGFMVMFSKWLIRRFAAGIRSVTRIVMSRKPIEHEFLK